MTFESTSLPLTTTAADVSSQDYSIASIFVSFSIILTFAVTYYSSSLNFSVVVILSFAAIALGKIERTSSINTAGLVIDGL